MKAGELRNRITVQAKTVPETINTFRNPQEEWADAFELWAAYEPSGSREFPTSWKRFAETTARFRVRSNPQTRQINADKHRIVMIFDRTASPLVSQVWNISPPYPREGKPFELIIEGSEIT